MLFFISPLVSFLAIGKIWGIDQNGIQEIIQKSVLNPTERNILWVLQTVTSVFAFALSAILYALVVREKPGRLLQLATKPSCKFLIGTSLLVLAAIPLVSVLAYLNFNLPYPMGQLGSYLLEQENARIALTKSLLEMHNPWQLTTNIFLVGVVPAVCEELFFRGAMQGLFQKWSNKRFSPIIITSLLFALVHFRYAQLLPIFTMSLLLGYVFYRTQNLWYTIVMHTVFNASTVIYMYLSPENIDIADNPLPPVWLIAIGLVLFALSSRYLLKNIASKKDIHTFTSENQNE